MPAADPMRTPSARPSPATSVAAPATPRSSRRSRSSRRPRRAHDAAMDRGTTSWRRPHERHGGPHPGPDQRPSPPAFRERGPQSAGLGGCDRGGTWRRGPGCALADGPDRRGHRRPSHRRHTRTGHGRRVRDPGRPGAAGPRTSPQPQRLSLSRTMSVEPPVRSPRSLAEAYAAMAEAGSDPGIGVAHGIDGAGGRAVAPIAGGTDLMVALTGELGEPPGSIVDLWALDALRGIEVDGDRLVLGALTTYAELRRSRAVREHLPALAEAAATIGAAQIQGRGTLGGNAANASPAGDTLPLLLACDASLVLGSVRGE